MADRSTVAVLGTGIMGAAMARNLLKAGMEVRVWNRSPEKAAPLAADGAMVAESPVEATEGADFLAPCSRTPSRRRLGTERWITSLRTACGSR